MNQPSLPHKKETSLFRSNAISLPDGTQQLPLGSGVITRILGEGGMANVYEIWNSQLEMHRAVKLLKPTSTEDNLDRFQTEIKISSKLHHPNIIEVYSVGAWNNLPYIEMEKIEGCTLRNLLDQRGALSPLVACAVSIMTSRALKYAHTQECTIYGKTYRGIVHRDIKPENIMVCENGSVKLMDFGIARPSEASFHTIDGEVLGTLQYLSPEQLAGEDLDHRSDIYSLGTTLYEMLTGKLAFPDKNIKTLITQKCCNNYESLSDFDIVLPENLLNLVHKCLENNRENRVKSVNLLLGNLDKIYSRMTSISPEDITRQFISAPDTRRNEIGIRKRRALWPTVFAATILFCSIILWSSLQFGKSLFKKTGTSTTQTLEAKSPPVSVLELKDVQLSTDTTRTAQIKIESSSLPPIKSIKNLPLQTRFAKTSSRAPVKIAFIDSAAHNRTFVEPSKQLSAQIRTSLLQRMSEKHSTADVSQILRKESLSANHIEVLALCKELSADKTYSPLAEIYKLRTLVALNRTTELASAVNEIKSDDGEFLIYKAQVALNRKDINSAEKLATAALSKDHAYIDYDALKREVFLLQARCATEQFDNQITEESWGDASGAWWRLKNELRAIPDHRYYQLAEKELRRMGTKIKSKGE